MLRRAAILAATILSGTVSVQTAEVRQSTTYFTIRGSTLDELDAELRREGPEVGGAGMRHPGATRVEFDGYVTYRSESRSCHVDEIGLSLDLEMTLPRWKGARDATPETRTIWSVIADDIERHEREHAAIARQWARRMESALRNLAPRHNCESMETHVNATVRRYLRDHERAQIAFDVVEGREINRRLARALRDAEQTAAAE